MTATEQIDAYLAGLPDWQRRLADRIRALIHAAVPDMAEEWKWGTPVFSRGGSVCAIGAFKDHLKVNFFKGAALADPKHLFNAGLDAKASRAIDLAEGDDLDAEAFRDLVRAAAQLHP